MDLCSSSPEVVSIDCLFTQSLEAYGIPIAIKRSLVYYAAPLAVMIIVLLSRALVRLLAALLRCVRQRSPLRHYCDLHGILQVICVAFLVVMFFFYPLLIRVSFGMLACLTLDIQPGNSSTSITSSSFSDPYLIC